MLARLPRRRGKLPKSAYTNFQILARRLARMTFRVDTSLEARFFNWMKEAGGARRHTDVLRSVTRGEAIAVVVPLLRGVAIPRMDEVLRLQTGLDLARNLRNRRIGRVVTLAWPARKVGFRGETGISAILQRNGEIDDIGFRGGDVERYLRMLRNTLPGTGFSSLVLDQVARAADPYPDLFKARLLLKWFDDESIAFLPPDAVGGDIDFGHGIARLFSLMPVVGVVGGIGLPTTGVHAGQPVPYPAVSATIVEGKVERLLAKFDLSVESVLCGDARIEETAGLNLPVDVRADVSAFKENLLSEVLRMELGLNELGFKPANEVRKALNSFDVGCDKLRNHAVAVAGRELETNRRQLRKLFQYLLPDGQPQQEVVSLLHFLDFYGLDFLDGLRDVLQADDLRHQVVYVAPEASV